MSTLVTIKPIKKEGKWMNMLRYANTKDYITPYYDSAGIIQTGLTKEDEERLGKLLKKDLSPISEFWHDFRVVMLGEKEKTFNTISPLQELEVLFLKGHKRVANSFLDKTLSSDYYIVDENAEAQVTNNKAAVKIKANLLFSSLTSDQKKDILKLYPGFSKTEKVSPSVVEAKLYEELEKNPAKFVSLTEDNKRDMKILVKDLVDNQILRKNRNAYYYGDDVLGHDEESTITHLEDPKNQGLKIALMQELEDKTGYVKTKTKK